MSSRVQASTPPQAPKKGCARRALTALAPCVWLLAGCVSSTLGIGDPGVDHTVVTRSIPPAPAAVSSDADKASDETTIRNAVSSVHLAEISDGRIPWANPGTGSRGEISGVSEYREGEALCRRFTASRESYAGVALYRGDACLGRDGAWWMRTFSAA